MTRPRRRHTTSEGYMRAAEDLTGCLDLDHGAALREYQQFNTEAARAAFADKWLHLAARRLNETWPMVYELLRLVRDRQLYTKAESLEGAQGFDSFHAYFCAVIGQPFETWADLEQTYHFVQQFRPDLLDKTYSEAVQATMRARGRPRKDEEKGVINTFFDGTRGSTNVAYLTARLARDRPDILGRLHAGEFSSVRQAAKAAGIVNERTPLEQLQHWWTKASTEERTAFAQWRRDTSGEEP